MKKLLSSTLDLAGDLLRNRVVLIALAVGLTAGIVWFVWFRKKNNTTGGAAVRPGGTAGVLRQVAPVNAGVVEGISIPPHPGTPELFRVDLFPEFSLLPEEINVWASHLFNYEIGAKILKRGFNYVETQQAMKTTTPTTRGQRFAIMYRNSFNEIPFRMANLPALKGAVDAYIGGQFGGAVDMLGYDPEHDEENPEYGQVVSELLKHARSRWGVRYVDFLGVDGAVIDFNVNNQPPSRAYFYPYVDEEATFDGVLPYFTPSHIATGDWLYSIFRTTRNFRAVFPNKPIVSYWWHFTFDKTQYLPNHVCEASAIFAWMAGGGTVINWEDASKGYVFAGDEHLMNGYLRLSRVNALRKGPVRFFVPEISTDGGKTWRYNDEITAKAQGDPMIGLTNNAEGWLLAGHASRLPSGEQKVLVRAEGFPAYGVTLKARQTHLEAII